MPTIEDLSGFLQVCRNRSVYKPEVDERFCKCVSTAIYNGFGGSDLSGLESASDRKFVLRRMIPQEEVGAYALSFKRLILDYWEYVRNKDSFFKRNSARRFQRKQASNGT